MTGPILIHRGDILAGLKSLYVGRPDWYECLRAVAIQADVVNEFDKFVAVMKAEYILQQNGTRSASGMPGGGGKR